MKLLFLILFLFPFLSQGGKYKGTKTAEVLRIIDGDTFDAKIFIDKDYSVKIKVRILGIDTPEKNGDCEEEKILAKKAKELLKRLLPKKVKLKNLKDGRYNGRVLANVVLNNGKDLTPILLKYSFVRSYEGKKRKSWCDWFLFKKTKLDIDTGDNCLLSFCINNLKVKEWAKNY